VLCNGILATMNRKLPLLLLLFTATALQAQSTDPTPASSSASSSSSPSAGGAGQASAPQSAVPVVIRSTDNGTGKGAEASPSASAKSPAKPSTAGDTAAENDFQQFVQATLGHDLPVFGSSLFENNGSNFAPTTNAVPPADYVLGTGDQLLIRTSGKIDMDVRVTVDRNGQIFIPRIGMLTVAGLQLDRLSDFIHNAIAQQFSGFELSVSLGDLRSIQILVLGNAKTPGIYTISALNTLINTLFASGGPSSNGTLRDIQLKREGKVITHLDVYRLLLLGDKSSDVRLLPGDVLFIPPLGPQVAIDGDVSTPGIFEILPGETVGKVLSYAGGLTPVAESERAVLEHVIDHSRRSIEELSLTGKGLDIPMESADILRVLPVSPKISNAVTLRGNVATPGRYAWRPGMRISDLIPSREFVLTRAYYNHQNSLDQSGGSHPFGGTSSKTGASGAASGSDSGASDSANAGTTVPETAVHDTEINWNYAVIERLNPGDLTTQIVSFKLGEAIANHGSAENKELQAGDVVVVYSRNDVELPLELQAKFVKLDGQVNAPGTYRVEANETLRDLVMRAGGLAPHAYLFASKLTRDSVSKQQADGLKKLVDQESLAILAPSNQRVSISSSGGTGGSDLDLRKAYVEALSKVQPDGRLVLQILPGAASINDVPAIMLEDGDHFFVPAAPDTINVLGAVYSPSALAFTPGMHMESYLHLAGGAMREADTKREFVVRANGSVVNRDNTKDFKHLSMNPGDTVIVPAKLRTSIGPISLTDLANLGTTVALLAVALRTN